MKIEVSLHTLDDKEWWFDLGISIHRTPYYEKKRVVTLALVFFSIYLRW